ncbi:ABC transporter ATP-binding protein/permease [Ruania suaedae]|uniref:ABC transporter ATP-binding protein n=1 Tax=Ruania suaedae TaxID=2897774 RepID=UPI001E3437BF|nr:ABC transporter ATP-binding protein [Ruania suaedae]UFU04332.1 ABC transporter ATP-binding protein/permease [Ruania suaedae]
MSHQEPPARDVTAGERADDSELKAQVKVDERPRPGPGPGGGLGVPAEKPRDLLGAARRMVVALRADRAWVLVAVVLGTIGTLLTVVGPKMLGNATNVIFDGLVGRGLDPSLTRAETIEALRAAGEDTQADMLAGMPGVVPGQGVDFERLAGVLAVVLAVYAGAFLFTWLQGRLITTVVQQVVYRLREQVETKLARLPLRYFDRQARGEVLSRVTNDIDNVAQSLQQTLSQLITSVLTVLGVLAMMVWISWQLALVALVTIPLSAVVVGQIAKRSQPEFVEQWKRTGTVNAHVEEMYTGHDLVHVFGHQQAAEATFREENDRLFRASFRAQFITGTIQPVMGWIANVGYVAIAVLGGLRVASGTMSLGDVQAFVQYSRQFSQPITQIASLMNLMQSGAASAERVFDLLDEEEESADPQQPATLEAVSGRVAFEAVDFSYRSDTPLIEGLSLVAEPGQTIAIVGPTGAGKTTLVNLLMRFYEVQAGRITIDGVDTRDLTRAQLRSCIGMVLQDTWLFNGSIEDNIRYGAHRPVTDAELLAAAEATGVDPFVRTLPEGYRTALDEEGTTGIAVSAGEKQLLTIARAFLADPAILILDEATSSVDTRTEVLVQRAMNALRRGRTSFVIAHRLSTIRDADVILVMEEGSIVEQGSHDALMAADGAYSRLYRSQFAAAATEVD